MNIIDKYIAKIVLAAIFIIFLAILSLDSFISFIRISNDIGRGSFDLYHAFQYLLLSIPSRIYLIFPFAVPIGAMMGLSYLNSSSELIAMRTAGISTYQIIFSVLKLGIFLSLLSFVIGEYLAPITDKIAQREKNIAIYNNLTLDIKKEIWVRDKNTYTNIRSVLADKSLSGISIYTFQLNNTMKHSLYADKAYYNGNNWILVDVKKTIFESNQLIIENYPQLKWQTPFNLDLVDLITSEISNLSTYDLYQFAQYLDKNNINSKSYYLQFWQRITAPFTLLVILLFTFPFSISNNRSGKMGEKLLIGIVIGLVFNMTNKISAEFALLFDFSPFLSATLLTSITLVISLLLIRRIR
ncbi:MAG: LPS export ABC transporter permease LptG [Pseudomonadota bacterium]